MGYLNPLLKLPAMQEILQQPVEERARWSRMLRQLRKQCDELAETSLRRRKMPMLYYWRVVATYVRHCAHALDRGHLEVHRSQRPRRFFYLFDLPDIGEPGLQGLREQFESAAGPGLNLQRNGDGIYVDEVTAAAWWAWCTAPSAAPAMAPATSAHTAAMSRPS